jgi:hypothetical protein
LLEVYYIEEIENQTRKAAPLSLHSTKIISMCSGCNQSQKPKYFRMGTLYLAPSAVLPKADASAPVPGKKLIYSDPQV